MLIFFSTILGAAFLYEASGLVPAEVWDFVATGWILFVIDSFLTFVRPETSFYLAFVLAALALGASLPQPAHYAFISEGSIVPAAIFVSGSIAQGALLVLVPLHVIVRRRASVKADL